MSSQADIILGRLVELLGVDLMYILPSQFSKSREVDYRRIEQKIREAIERADHIIPECPSCGEVGTLDQIVGTDTEGVVCVECRTLFTRAFSDD